MAESSIPVDLLNPGQVFACLGLLELADKLLGNAQGAFDWCKGSDTQFKLSVPDNTNPIASVLGMLATTQAVEVEPVGWPSGTSNGARFSATFPSSLDHHRDGDGDYTRTKLPILLQFEGPPRKEVAVEHWTDESSRPDFKLYAGNRSGFTIAQDMVHGKRSKPAMKTGSTKILNWGVEQLWKSDASGLSASPFDILVPMAGSFNFDPRGAWNAIDEGYSPDKQGHSLRSSPLVEILAAAAMENMRPHEHERGVFQYSTWSDWLSPELARVAIQGRLSGFPIRRFQFALGHSGKNKIVSFAKELPH